MKKLSHLVVGTGRCGTVLMARVLTAAGIPCGHEAFFDWHGVEQAVARFEGRLPPTPSAVMTRAWKDGHHVEVDDRWWADPKDFVAESSYMAVPFLGHESLRGTTVIHVVRNPVSVVHSFVNLMKYFPDVQHNTINRRYEAFIYHHAPELLDAEPGYDRAALYWLLWNESIDRTRPSFFHKIENGAEPVYDFLGVPDPGVDFGTKTNTFDRGKPTERFTPGKIKDASLRRRFLDHAERYGYSISKNLLI